VTVVRGTVLVLALLVVAGCGSDGTKARRDAVNAYFADVGKAQIGLLSKQGQIDITLQAFSLTTAAPSELARLRQARVEVDGALRGVRALRPPKDARKLHGLIVQRLALQRSVIDELIAATVYIPKLAATAPPLQSAVGVLRRDLGGISVTSATRAPTVTPSGTGSVLDSYAAAFGGYGDALKPVSARLESLSAPPILRPPLDAERDAVKRSIVLCATIRQSLLARNITAANAAIHSLFSVSAALNGTETRQRQAAAARAYDNRLHRIDVLAAKANRERNHLVQVVG
jgi:hypothetical protein